VTNLKSIQAALKGVEKCVGEGGLTLLINNAGIWVYSDMETENAKDMMRVYSVNSIVRFVYGHNTSQRKEDSFVNKKKDWTVQFSMSGVQGNALILKIKKQNCALIWEQDGTLGNV
ncbi:hypothetical protein E2320_001153, partial [Naja naja]